MPIKAAQSFVASAAINLFLHSSPATAILGGAIAATASLIEAVTRPIIRTIFPKSDSQGQTPKLPLLAQVTQLLVPSMVARGIASAFAPWIGLTYTTSTIFFTAITWWALNDDVFNKNEGVAFVF
jgi:hypothetical protein